MAQSHKLTWGAITLAEPNSSPTTDGWVIEAQAGSDFGNPEALLDIVQSLLTDGTLAVIQRWDNREATIRLRVSAPSVAAGPALAQAEAALMGEVLRDPRPSPLVWTPPATNAAVTVFDVVAAELDRDNSEGWDFEETQREYRFYELTLRALPFARPPEETTLAALAPNPPTPTESLIDDGTSATNWSASVENVGGAEQRRNLIRNPSLETGTSGWGLVQGTSLDRGSGGAQSGTYYGRGTSTSGVMDVEVRTPAATVTAGNTYTASAYLAEPPPSSGYVLEDISVQFVWFDASGNPSFGSSSSGTPTESWQRLSVTQVAPAGTVSAKVSLQGSSSIESGTKRLLFDAVLLEESGTLDPYFDGDTADTSSVEYAWSGIAHDSQAVAAAVPTPAVVSGAVEATGSRLTSSAIQEVRFGLLRSAAASMASLPYLRATIDTDVDGVYGELSLLTDGVVRGVVAAVPSATSGFTDYYIETGDFSTFEARWTDQASEATLSVADLTATDTLPQLPKQRARLATITGSAPTQAAVRLYDDTTGVLGKDVLVYTSRSDFSPNLRRDWLASSDTVTADSDMISGAYNGIGTVDMVFRVPVSQLEPGTYALMTRIGVDLTAATVEWEAFITDDAGGLVVGSAHTLSGSRDFPAGSLGGLDFEIHHIDTLSLPPVRAEGAQYVQLTLSSTAAVNVDEVWLFNLDDGSLTWVHDTSSLLRWVEIRSPELDAPRPAVYGSASGDGTDAADVSYLCESFGIHKFMPGQTQVFTVASMSDESKSEIDYFPRFHSHVESDE